MKKKKSFELVDVEGSTIQYFDNEQDARACFREEVRKDPSASDDLFLINSSRKKKRIIDFNDLNDSEEEA